ncbi:hypothetical protein MUGA111182_20795 [Mucilaginibacter galii]
MTESMLLVVILAELKIADITITISNLLMS